jgi:hypothetical protein
MEKRQLPQLIAKMRVVVLREFKSLCRLWALHIATQECPRWIHSASQIALNESSRLINHFLTLQRYLTCELDYKNNYKKNIFKQIAFFSQLW